MATPSTKPRLISRGFVLGSARSLGGAACKFSIQAVSILPYLIIGLQRLLFSFIVTYLVTKQPVSPHFYVRISW
jgi:hypothetical protein